MSERSSRPTRAGRAPRGGPAGRGSTGPGRDAARRRVAAAAAAAAAGPREQRRRSRLTGRAAVLVLVLAVLMVSYASSLRAYLQQRTQIQTLNAEIAERQAGIDDLEAQKLRWDDPAFVRSQARERFGYVAPGETSYVVLGEDGLPIEGDASLQDPDEVLRTEPTAWWSTAWDSVELAGNPPRLGKGPANEIDGSADPGAPSDSTDQGE